jgi:Skp family chaperone for outer membrane proteins
MNRIFVIVAAFALFAGAAVSSSAQTRPATTPAANTPARPATTTPAANTPVAAANVPSTKIAIVNTEMFGDEKAGIRRYLTAVQTVEREYKPKQAELQQLQTRIKALAEELQKLGGAPVVDPKTIQAKQEEGERLQRDLKYKKEQFDSDVEKRYKTLVEPVTIDISKALYQYASQNGLTMILDISKMLPAILSINPAVDVTQQFIADFNSKNP